MIAKQERNFDVNQYRPLNDEDVVSIGGLPIPERAFRPGEDVAWSGSINLAGTVFINVIHRDYPDAFCQIQCVQDDKGVWHVFFAHISPSNHHLPDELAEALVPEIFPRAMEQLQRGRPN